MQRKMNYIYHNPDWPKFRWDNSSIIALLAEVKYLQGLLLGKMQSIGFEQQNEASLETITLDVLKSTEIEGQLLNVDQVRSSVARKLGIVLEYSVNSDRDVDGIVNMVMDATARHDQLLTTDRLFAWQSSLFPSGRSGLFEINVGKWRNDAKGPMQVVSSPIGNEKLHFQAQGAESIPEEMEIFLKWFNQKEEDLFLKAGVAHLWFVTIHPFDDGNGRVGRALSEMLLARADNSAQRFYSLSNQLSLKRKQYYLNLEQAQKGNLDITDWLEWFLLCLKSALLGADQILEKILFKHQFWNKYASQVLNKRQVLMLNKILDGFYGKLTSSKWAKMTHCSQDTALRDIQLLIDVNILKKGKIGGRSTNYSLVK